MKKECYDKMRTKRQLAQKAARGEEFAIWKLTPDRRAYVEQLGYEVEAHEYQITTKTFYNARGLKSTLLRDIHYTKVRRKNTLVRTLSQEEKKLLKEFGVKYQVLNYKIHLQR